LTTVSVSFISSTLVSATAFFGILTFVITFGVFFQGVSSVFFAKAGFIYVLLP